MRQRFLVTREEVLEVGGSKHLIASRLDRGLWTRLHDGVYQVDRRPPEWEDRLAAAVLACGPSAAASHRAALVVWGLDGIRGAPLEVTMPFGNLAFPEGVVVHRTRRPWDRVEARHIPVTTVERTLLDSGALLPDGAVGKALDSALRMGLTTMEAVQQTLATDGGRGVRGTRRLRRVMSDRSYDVATGPGAEFDILQHMKLAAFLHPS